MVEERKNSLDNQGITINFKRTSAIDAHDVSRDRTVEGVAADHPPNAAQDRGRRRVQHPLGAHADEPLSHRAGAVPPRRSEAPGHTGKALGLGWCARPLHRTTENNGLVIVIFRSVRKREAVAQAIESGKLVQHPGYRIAANPTVRTNERLVKIKPTDTTR